MTVLGGYAIVVAPISDGFKFDVVCILLVIGCALMFCIHKRERQEKTDAAKKAERERLIERNRKATEWSNRRATGIDEPYPFD